MLKKSTNPQAKGQISTETKTTLYLLRSGFFRVFWQSSRGKLASSHKQKTLVSKTLNPSTFANTYSSKKLLWRRKDKDTMNELDKHLVTAGINCHQLAVELYKSTPAEYMLIWTPNLVRFAYSYPEVWKTNINIRFNLCGWFIPWVSLVCSCLYRGDELMFPNPTHLW